jgi:hypothetical protein
MKKKVIFGVQVEIDDALTDADSTAEALDRLMETALSTPGILEEYGSPKVGHFVPFLPRVDPPRGGPHFISMTCQGETCGMCHDLDQMAVPATHKVGEEIPHDDPFQARHNLTCYVCCRHFVWVVGKAAPCQL